MESYSLLSRKIFIAAVLLLSISANSKKIEKQEMSETIEHNQHEKYMNAKTFLEIGKKYIFEKKYELAIENFKSGIRELGQCYRRENSIDETGTLIMLSKIKEEEENFDSAAITLRKVLESRLGSYAEIINLKK